MSSDLKLADAKELLDELLSRCDVGIVYLVGEPFGEEGRERFLRNYIGDPHRYAGLAMEIAHIAIERSKKREIHDEDEGNTENISGDDE